MIRLVLEMASSIDWSDSDPSEAWSEAARGSLITILEIMDQVIKERRTSFEHPIHCKLPFIAF